LVTKIGISGRDYERIQTVLRYSTCSKIRLKKLVRLFNFENAPKIFRALMVGFHVILYQMSQ
jgi:hypothetical protein